MDRPLRANLNENPFNPLEEFKEDFLETFKNIEINRYPDPDQRDLRKSLAKKLNVEPENIIVGNGSDELILYILIAFYRKNFPLVIPYPTFTMYEKIADTLGISIIKIPLDENWNLPLNYMETAVKDGAITFLGYPNNPTANCWPPEEIESIINKNPGITIIDEAYYEFSGKTFLRLAIERENVIIIRTFSKAFGLAGARIGYAISTKKNINFINEVRLPFNLSLFSEKTALLMLEKDDWVKEKVKEILNNRAWLIEKLKSLSFLKVYPSETNFILCKVLDESLDVISFLRERNVEIRKPDINGNYIRISIGKREEVEKIWLLLRELQEKLKFR
ncbi:MAG: histidinol-phosphate transaminase [Synergistetes bacterium]|nr:histidinol-phosphate transaminase [Synergistota bacterium]MCX8128040.1 histidinol-phosphate transaminase [Synergistota bacterium]MDW8193078.1 histidinol-phosphate transaminase [Synergistota bacterium]